MNIDPAILLGLRPRMMSVAYRMLGSGADAEDAVQDAFVRLQAAAEVSSPEEFLIRVTTQLCGHPCRVPAHRERGPVRVHDQQPGQALPLVGGGGRITAPIRGEKRGGLS